MRRFVDSILFAALFVLDSLTLLVLSLIGGIETGDPGRLAPMTVGTVIIIACPALLLVAALGVARALVRTAPVGFYGWAVGGTIGGAVTTAVAGAIAQPRGVEVGFSWMAWFFGIQALAFIIALIIAATGGIEYTPRGSRDELATEASPAPEEPELPAPPTTAPELTDSTASSPDLPVSADSPVADTAPVRPGVHDQRATQEDTPA